MNGKSMQNLKKDTKFSQITFNKPRKLVQEDIDLVLVEIAHSGKPTNNTHQQNSSQKGTCNRSLSLQYPFSFTISFNPVIIITSTTFWIQEPL